MNEDGEVIEAALTTSDMAAVTRFGMAALALTADPRLPGSDLFPVKLVGPVV